MLGCLVHLCSLSGRIVRGHLEGLSLRTVRALLRCSLQEHWSHEVHQQLVALGGGADVCAPGGACRGAEAALRHQPPR